MKDYPAMNNPSYFIDTATTGDKGQAFLDILNQSQRAIITNIIPTQSAALKEIADIRMKVSTELRKALTGGAVNKALVYSLIQRYGVLDGKLSALYAISFATVNKTLTSDQRSALVQLRDLTVVPTGAYKWSTAIATPSVPKNDYLFGIGTFPSTAANVTPPTAFINAN
jgi:hypothetical protein